MKKDLTYTCVGQKSMIVVNDDDSYVIFDTQPTRIKDLFGEFSCKSLLLDAEFLFVNDLDNHINSYTYDNYRIEKFNKLMEKNNIDFKKIRKIVNIEFNGEYYDFRNTISRATVQIYYPHSRIKHPRYPEIITSNKLNDYEGILEKALKIEIGD